MITNDVNVPLNQYIVISQYNISYYISVTNPLLITRFQKPLAYITTVTKLPMSVHLLHLSLNDEII